MRDLFIGLPSPFISRPRFSIRAIFAAGEPGVAFAPSTTTCFTDVAGTTPAAVGQAVALMLDESGRDNHATQSVIAKRPILRQSGALYYLEFDGVDDAMVTPTITPGTDKVQVFAGVRKLSDASYPVIVETSALWTANNGSFSLGGGGNNGYTGGSRGTVTQNLGNGSAGPSAPDSAALTFTGDISGDSLTLGRNGTQFAQNTNDQGTGNYLAYPLYIGARNGTVVYFNGHIYSLTARFGPNLDADTIAKAETYTAAKTGVTL